MKKLALILSLALCLGACGKKGKTTVIDNSDVIAQLEAQVVELTNTVNLLLLEDSVDEEHTNELYITIENLNNTITIIKNKRK